MAIYGWFGCVPAIILCCLLPFSPESPRQLICQGKTEEAAKVIARIFPHGTSEQVQQKVMHITFHIEQVRSHHGDSSIWWQLKQLYVIPSNFRAMFAACGLMAISQLGGFNSLMYYSSTFCSGRIQQPGRRRNSHCRDKLHIHHRQSATHRPCWTPPHSP